MNPDNIVLAGLIFSAIAVALGLVALVALVALAAYESFLEDEGGDDDIESNYWDVR